MKPGRTPLWLLRDLAALVGIVLSFWPLMIMVIANGRRAMLGKKVSPRADDCIMQMLPMAEARLHYALCRQAWRALGWNVRDVQLEILPPIKNWSDLGARFEAYTADMMDLHAAAARFTEGLRRIYRIRTRVDANAVRAGGCPLRHASHATSPSLRLEEESHRSLSSSGDSRGRWRATSSSRDGGGSRRLAFAAQPRAPPGFPRLPIAHSLLP